MSKVPAWKKPNKKWIAGFWRRIGASMIDTVILAAVGFILGLVLESTFVAMGARARLVGFLVSLIYFDVMNSVLTGAQTPVKKALKLRVVTSSNESISLARSMARYVVLATPFFISDINLENNPLFPYLFYPLSFIIFGGGLSTMGFEVQTAQKLR